MKKFILDFLKEEEGQTSTEYILLVVVVAMIIFKFKTKLEESLLGSGGVTDNVFNKINALTNDTP
jgi:pilus assembly protein Flp/PilA